MATSTLGATEYLLSDYGHSLFPLATTSYLISAHTDVLREYLYKKVLDPANNEHHFRVQQRCYAAKRGFHLRRTVKLDSVPELFIYDIVYSNRKSFCKDHRVTGKASDTDSVRADRILLRRRTARSRRRFPRRAPHTPTRSRSTLQLTSTPFITTI